LKSTGNFPTLREVISGNHKFKSNWHQNMLNGYTEIEYADGTKFNGLVNMGDLVSGKIYFATG
jgi:hypothetical protein